MTHMSSLLSEIRVPLPRPDPSPPPTQMIRLLNRYKTSNTLIQTVLIPLLIYRSVQVHGPDISPLPPCRTHDILLALGLLSGHVCPEELAGGPVTAWHSELVLKYVVLEGTQSAVQVVAQTGRVEDEVTAISRF